MVGYEQMVVFASMGYRVMVASMFGDVEYSYEELVEFMEDGSEMDEVFDHIDEEERIVWYYDGQDYDE